MKRSNDSKLHSESQTQFAEQELLYESASVPEAPSSTSQEQPEEKKNLFQRLTRLQKIVAGLIGFGFIILIMFLLFALMQSPMTNPPQIETTPTPSPKVNDPFSIRILELKESISDSDPTVDNYPAPPVDFSISLD